MKWRAYLCYYLTYILGFRRAPLVERLSYVVGLGQFQDEEYQTAIRDLASC